MFLETRQIRDSISLQVSRPSEFLCEHLIKFEPLILDDLCVFSLISLFVTSSTKILYASMTLVRGDSLL